MASPISFFLSFYFCAVIPIFIFLFFFFFSFFNFFLFHFCGLLLPFSPTPFSPLLLFFVLLFNLFFIFFSFFSFLFFTFLILTWIYIRTIEQYIYNKTYDPVREISNNVVCATSKASDQPAHTRSLIRAFASSLSILWLLSYWLNTIWRS